MTTVAVTGGSGKLGTAVVARLVDEGYTVINLDLAPPKEPRSAFTRVDFSDYGQAADALAGIDDRHQGLDALVHLAALPSGGLMADAQTFRNNMLVTYNIFQAARRAGIKNVVYASSETLLGIPFTIDPPYLPVDEEYPARPESTYSLVKHLEETMVQQFVRWDPELKVTALRFSNVIEESQYADFPSFDADITLRDWNLWSYIDRRDGAQAVQRALEHPGTGFEVFNIAATDTVMSRPTAELAAERFPGVEIRGQLDTHTSLISSEKAVRVLGFKPQHFWRDYAGHDGE